jgi:hypothetical protein
MREVAGSTPGLCPYDHHYRRESRGHERRPPPPRPSHLQKICEITREFFYIGQNLRSWILPCQNYDGLCHGKSIRSQRSQRHVVG